jgi:hypothetical protein
MHARVRHAVGMGVDGECCAGRHGFGNLRAPQRPVNAARPGARICVMIIANDFR